MQVPSIAWRRSISLSSLGLFSLACAAQPMNPSFPVTREEAKTDLIRIATAPKKLDRPLVIIGGIFDPGFGPHGLRRELNWLTPDRRIVIVPMGECLSFEQCRRKVVHAVDLAFPNADLTETVEVDVIGESMGGLVARYAALPVGEGHARRLHIARLFTISSPLSGAYMAEKLPAIYPLFKPLRPNSDLVKEVNARSLDYPIYSYVRLGDLPVGVSNAAVPGRVAWWLPTPPLTTPHVGAFWDPRIVADIARRLRGETPLASDPPAPLPVDS